MKPLDYSTFLFDWDGCLAQTLQIWLDSYKTVFAEYEIYPSDKDVTSKVFGDWNGPMKLGISQEDIDEYTRKLLAMVNERIKTVPLYADAKEVIIELKKRGKKLALVTTSKKESYEEALKLHGLTEKFDVILDADSVTEHKPSPEIILKALEGLSAEKASALMLGDSQRDIQAANNAGVDSLLFYPPQHDLFYEKNDLEKFEPKYVIKSWKELL
jgi:HAD superfamily hydrolase (TIGR01509 family)